MREIANAIPCCQTYGSAASVKFRYVRKKKPEKMRSNYFLFLRILEIRVGFEGNSMDSR
jgi:hypothetical protein